MIKTRAWPVRAMYMLVAAALVMSLIIVASPAQSVSAASQHLSHWDRVTTPSEDGWKLAPNSQIYDWAIGDDGEVAYAVVEMYREPTEEWTPSYLLRSTDHAATWRDITSGIKTEISNNKKGLGTLCGIHRVACAPDDADFIAVSLCVDPPATEFHERVFISADGGATFKDAGEVKVGDAGLKRSHDLAVSPAVAGERSIAIVGVDNDDLGAIFRCRVQGDFASAWEDARYVGWDGDDTLPMNPVSIAITDVKFAPSWDRDRGILVTTVAENATSGYTIHLQTGTWVTNEGWNKKSTAGIDPVAIAENVEIPVWLANYADDWRVIAGVTLPNDYAAREAGTRHAWVWVNHYDAAAVPKCTIFRVRNTSANPVGPLGQVEDGEVWLTNVAYLGTIASGKAIAGVLGTGTYSQSRWELWKDDCEGPQVYRNDDVTNMDVCCLPWDDSCKPPTGTSAMAVFWASNDPATEKAYAVALQSGEEGAWSWSFDDGETWNQLSLIDTYIEELSDVAVSPDCNKTMLVSINREGCDSVWLHAVHLHEDADYSGTWLRTWAHKLEKKHGLLRLAPDEETGETVYLVDRETETIYWNTLETLACWRFGATTGLSSIVDLAVKDKQTIYALDSDGRVAMSDDYALNWQKPVKSELDTGWTIAVHGDDVLVGSREGEVAHSADGGETFEELEDLPISGYVTVAFDSYFDANDMIYVAVGDYTPAGTFGGIYRWILAESEAWTDLLARPTERQLTCDSDLGCPTTTRQVFYTGLVLDNADGNPMTNPSTGGVLYASYVAEVNGDWYTGVARQLTPAWDFCCDETEWDYLVKGKYPEFDDSYFRVTPKALKICGCLTPDTYTKLFAIGWYPDVLEHPDPLGRGSAYDMEKAEYGTVWMFEDCYSKWGPDLRNPADGAIVPALLCAGCNNMPFSMAWDRMCDACNYQVQFATDSGFNQLLIPPQVTAPTPNSCIAGGWEVRPIPAVNPSVQAQSWFIPGETYYWRVRSVMAENGQVIRSWWSSERSFTVGLKAGTGVTLLTPESGATSVPRTNIAFAWTSAAEVDSYNWVLSPNADLSGPVDQQTLTNPAYKFTGTLSADTSYFWRVQGVKNGAVTSEALGSFTTAATKVYCSPQSGLCFNTEAELRAHHEQLQKDALKTPTWVWVVIAIGAVLVIVVIVLIFRTRRV